MGNNPLNDLFDRMGYGSLYIVQNFGPLLLTIFITPAMWAVSLFLTKCNFCYCGKRFEYHRIKWNRLMFFDGWLTLISETFLFASVCAGLNLYYNFSWKSYGDGINTFTSIFVAVVLIAFVFFVAIFYCYKKNFKKMRSREKRDYEFIARFGSLFSELNILRRKRLVVVYKTF